MVATPSVPSAFDLREMLRDERLHEYELDQAFWAYMRRVEYPLASYNHEFWEMDHRDCLPTARAISDPVSLMRVIDEEWLGAEIRFTAKDGRMLASVTIPGLGIGIKGDFRGNHPPSEFGRGVASAFLEAHDLALDLQQRLLAVDGVADGMPPYHDWPVEEVSPGRFGAVLHDLRLLSPTGATPQGARNLARSNHRGDYGIMLCRERYEKLFPEIDPKTSAGPEM